MRYTPGMPDAQRRAMFARMNQFQLSRESGYAGYTQPGLLANVPLIGSLGRWGGENILRPLGFGQVGETTSITGKFGVPSAAEYALGTTVPVLGKLPYLVRTAPLYFERGLGTFFETTPPSYMGPGEGWDLKERQKLRALSDPRNIPIYLQQQASKVSPVEGDYPTTIWNPKTRKWEAGVGKYVTGPPGDITIPAKDRPKIDAAGQAASKAEADFMKKYLADLTKLQMESATARDKAMQEYLANLGGDASPGFLAGLGNWVNQNPLAAAGLGLGAGLILSRS